MLNMGMCSAVCVCGAVLPHKPNGIHECVTLALDFIAVGTEPCRTTLCHSEDWKRCRCLPCSASSFLFQSPQLFFSSILVRCISQHL